MMIQATDLSEQTRQKISELLSQALASTYTLLLKTQNCHWNVTGANFASLHALFEEQYNILAKKVDELAERIRAMDHIAPASYQEYAKLSLIDDASAMPHTQAMLNTLLADHEKLGNIARALIETLEELNDPAGADLLTEQLAFHEKAAWMLRAHIT